MTLAELYEYEDEEWSERSLAEAVDVTGVTLNRVKTGVAPASLGLSLRIQYETGGLVMAKDLTISDRSRAELELISLMVREGDSF